MKRSRAGAIACEWLERAAQVVLSTEKPEVSRIGGRAAERVGLDVIDLQGETRRATHALALMRAPTVSFAPNLAAKRGWNVARTFIR